MLLENKAKCNHCGDIIESKHRHDYVSCSCKRIAVDGGLDYAKRAFTIPSDYTEMSIYQAEEEPIDKTNLPLLEPKKKYPYLDKYDTQIYSFFLSEENKEILNTILRLQYEEGLSDGFRMSRLTQ